MYASQKWRSIVAVTEASPKMEMTILFAMKVAVPKQYKYQNKSVNEGAGRGWSGVSWRGDGDDAYRMAPNRTSSNRAAIN